MTSPPSPSPFDRLLRRPEVVALAAVASSFNVPAHLVGGVVRDCGLRLKIKDVDAVVAGHGLEIAKRLSRQLPAKLIRLGGERFAALRLIGKNCELDIWDRHGDGQEHSLLDDLARRDLTVNAIALDLAANLRSAELYDPFGGLEDLARRRLRAVTDESFVADPLRVLRLPRLALQLAGFGPDRHTLELARDAAPALHRVSAERIRDELSTIFRLPGSHRALALLHQLDLYPALWLGQAASGGVRSDPLPLLRRASRPMELLPEAARRLEELGLPTLSEGEMATTRYAFSFRALAPTADPGGRLEAFREAGYLSKAVATRVAPLLRLPAPPRGAMDRRLFLYETAQHWRSALLLTTAQALATAELRSWTEQPLANLVQLALEEGDELTRPPRLLDGHEIQLLLGVRGREIGQALEEIERAWVEGQITNKEEARAWLERRRTKF